MSPISPPPAKGPRNGDLPAYVSNGLIGLRVREMPLQSGMTLVSGLAGEHPERRIEAAAPAPYPLAADIGLNGVWLSDQPWAVSDLVQTYDFETAELESRFVFATAERRAEVVVVTFASRTAPALVLQEIAVTVDGACDLTLRARVDPAGLRGRVARRRTDTPGEPEPACDGSMLWETDGAVSTCGLALHTEVSAEAERKVEAWDASGPLVSTYQLRAAKGRTTRLRQMAALVPSVIHARPDEEAVRRVDRARETGFDTLRRRNREAWADLWLGRIVVRGAQPDHQALIDAAYFYLNSSAHSASPASTSIFGLATWHDYTYYFGHVMWDVDAFCIPPLVLSQPDAARAALDFRTRGLAAAGSNARLSGRRGLQFPWEAAPMTAQEAAPGGGSAAHHEDHVSLHVARAFAMYADATGDEAFLREDAWPVVSGVADWFVSRTTRTDRGFEILRSMGPAEVPEPPDNDAFTLMTAAGVLRRALRMADQLGRQAPDAWEEVLDGLYLPVRSDGVIASHDDFDVREPKGATPSPLAGLFPSDFPANERQRRATLDFFLQRWPDYIGAPMLPALYSVWAAMTGDRDLALKLFEEGYVAYDQPRFHQCLEYRLDHPDSEVPAGPFFANLGGMLLGLMFGFTGLIIDDGPPETWARRPVVLPQGWEEIEIVRVWVRGRPARIRARHGDARAEVTFLST
ncbi:glycoside hydrolase family 65 protein [Brevundimonas intermedia]|uniref:Glycoside hydrolase family 65 protein n=1 Tax=Brevundimonas intermedia TaxID=74315 RepID=A0A4Y9RZ85_9CAUL|nr:glycoside hydrolase family 65 protein [Brevundimonas intermedia]TFW14213.1 glycoside hydrolase family 65 protein [Brevundimonas intermedia]